jgi:hypothetical protein
MARTQERRQADVARCAQQGAQRSCEASVVGWRPARQRKFGLRKRLKAEPAILHWQAEEQRSDARASGDSSRGVSRNEENAHCRDQDLCAPPPTNLKAPCPHRRTGDLSDEGLKIS